MLLNREGRRELRVRRLPFSRFKGLVVAVGLLAVLSGGCDSAKKPPTAPGDEEPAVGSEMAVMLLDRAELELVWIPEGSFMMGSLDSEFGRVSDEGPLHEVIFSRGFWLGKYEVTQGQWEAVMGYNPSRFKGTDRPVENVSWEAVQQFIGALNQAEGRAIYRLPTEAEWEYACRAGTTTRYSFGNDERELGEYAWYAANSGGSTQDVGLKKPNAWGLYDMHGNVWEWSHHWYGDYAAESQTDPTGPAMGSLRVTRGGCWSIADAWRFRSAYRSKVAPAEHYANLGFRLMRKAR